MTHAVRGKFGRHSRYSHDAHPGGWWKFGLAALVATAVGGLFVYSPLLRGSDRAAEPTLPVPLTLSPNAPSIAQPTTVIRQDQPVAPALESKAAGSTDAASTAPATANQVMTSANLAPAEASGDASQAQTGEDIRSIDFASVPAVQALASQLAGQVDKTQVNFADLTGDGSEEAVVPITSGGTFGNLAFVVLTEQAGAPEVILTRLAGQERRGLQVVIDGGQLSETSGVYGPSDANCCPGQIVKTYFRWDGNNLVPDRTETITIPQGKQAD